MRYLCPSDCHGTWNAGLVYCMDYIDLNFDWLEEKLVQLKDKYLLFDFPGQVELYTHENSVHNIVHKLQQLGYRVGRTCFTIGSKERGGM